MTAQSQLDMQELGVDEQTLAARREHLAALGVTRANGGAQHGGPGMTLRECMEAEEPQKPKPRRTRSDAGKPRAPKPEQPAGKPLYIDIPGGRIASTACGAPSDSHRTP